MGATFSSIQVRVASQEAVIEGLRGSLEEPAYVSPPVGGWVGVYPEGAKATDTLAAELSRRLSVAVFDWNVYDSDVFFYSLYENGGLRDEFNSAPGYFEAQTVAGDEEGEQERIDPARVQGDPEALLPYCVPGITLAAIKEVLQPTELAEPNPALVTQLPGFPEASLGRLAAALNTSADALRRGVEQKMREKYIFAEHQALDMALLLGMNEELAQSRYSDIAQDDLEDHTRDDFRLVGNENLSQSYLNQKLWDIRDVREPEDMRAWILKGADPNARNGSSETALMNVARYGLTEHIKILVEVGADVNAATTAAQEYGLEVGVTALMVAVMDARVAAEKRIATARLLLSYGADANAVSETGRTPLRACFGFTNPTQEAFSRPLTPQQREQAEQVAKALRDAGAAE